jgi:hypothetical protein
MNDTIYIGRVEAFEILSDFGVYELPRKGEEKWNVPAIATGKDITIIGKDGHGFYIRTMDNK